MRAPQYDEDGVIGSKPKRDELAGLGLFAGVQTTQEQAERDITRAAQHTPAPAEREEQQTDAFVGGMSDTEFNERIARIQRLVLDDLLRLALERKNLPTNRKPGVTAEDARQIARQKGLSGLLGEQQRAWSWLSAWLQTLARKGKLTKYKVAGITVKRMAENGNDQVVYLHPYDYRASGEAVA